ncbi:MAG: Wzy polymerase domain-containing protein [Rhodoferax sp.]|uniref:PglL family O-oligosaccharyltransferase n=1 Tax=Rhodoferax sp. TaxID=50421 RepID=UPI002735126C|nr:Wzy polymerase domain-containing protein [Rhodoferax sp.]MDP3337231.1 Wzy polymerase domain-containing protein [Rhodoferax sp.]
MRSFALALLITLPWLNPFSPGPTAAVMPLLFAWACAAGVLLLRASDNTPAARQRWAYAVAGAWLTAACLSAMLGLLQYFGATHWLGVWVNHTEVGLAYGNLRQRNQFASLMGIGLVALLWWVAQASPQKPGRHPGQFGLALLLAVLLGAGNAASSSRTGLLQLLVVVAMALVWQRRARQQEASMPAASALPWVLLAAVLSYAVANWALPWLAGLDPSSSGAWARLRAGDSACGSRLTLWHNVLYLIAQKPWLGWGWGELDYAHFITLYPGARFCDILDNAHNLPLHLAVELGLPLALLLCGGALWLILRARPWREPDASRQMAWAVLAVIVLHSLLEYPLWYGPFQMAAGLCVWLLLPAGGQWRRTLAPYVQATLAGMLLTFCALAGWQYHLASQIYLPPEKRAPAYRTGTLEKTRHVLLFQDQVRFAELTLTELTAANAEPMNRLAKDVLHFSPEARVVEIIINSARLLGREDEADFYLARLQAAFPQDHADWRKTHEP